MHEGHEPLTRSIENAAKDVVDAAIAVHRTLGPGLLESAYEVCLAHELEKRGRSVLRQVALPLVYDTIKLEAGYRIDLIVDNGVIVEVKSLKRSRPCTKLSCSRT
jgi:GxxExxY protein